MANNPNAAANLTPFTPDNAAIIGAKGGAAKKGKKHINTWIQELLEDEEFTAKIRIGYELQDFKGAPIKAIVKAQMIKAVEGDTKAFDALAKYGWPSKSEVDNSGEIKHTYEELDDDQLDAAIKAREARVSGTS